MLIIQDKILEADIMAACFMCNLEACKGACCWEGDLGAPLEADEIEILEKEYPNIQPFLTEEGIKKIEITGTNVYYPLEKMIGTPLLENAACAFMTRDENGIASCGIELAWKAGKTSFRKPISCHLYPIRAEKDPQTGIDILKYDRWDICSAACSKGNANKIKVFEFAKDALIRKYGIEWYEELEQAYEQVYKDQPF